MHVSCKEKEVRYFANASFKSLFNPAQFLGANCKFLIIITIGQKKPKDARQ